MKIIVARFNENIEWTKSFSNVLIFNKGQKLDGEYNVTDINNVGREGHTYYKYIYDNYDNLDDFTIFLQGDPFPHSRNLINNLNKYINNPKLNIDFEFLSEWIIDCHLDGCRHHYGLPLLEVFDNLFANEDNKPTKTKRFNFGAGAQFIVSKHKILSRSKEFYKKIIEMLEKHINPIEGFVIERFHKLIFTNM
jgi:hypothetical protein